MVGSVLYRVLQKINIRLMRVSNRKQRCPVLLFCLILIVICGHYTHMLFLHVDSSVMRFEHVKCLCDIGQKHYPSTDLLLCERPMDGWHVRCWCGLREDENDGEASPYVEILSFGIL